MVKIYLELREIDWQEYYVIPYNVTRETYIQSFQYKIFHRFYPCNYTLSIWERNHSSKCINCDEIDYLEHFFFKCNNVQSFWNMIMNWWRNTIGVTMNLSWIDVMFGISNMMNDNSIDIMNLCILCAKYYIHVKKTNREQIFFIDYIKFVKDRLKIEKAVCELNQLKSFEKRWSDFYNML